MKDAKIQDELLALFDALPAVSPEEMSGLWRGAGVASGHPLDGVLENLGWFGKRFHVDGRADALLFQFRPRRLTAIEPASVPLGLVFRLGASGRSRLVRTIFFFAQRFLRAKAPTATLHSVPFRGGPTAAMVYDRLPVTDYFRRMEDGKLLGVMCVRDDPRHYFFTLQLEGGETRPV